MEQQMGCSNVTTNDSEKAEQVNYYADVSIQDQIAELQGTLGTPREDSWEWLRAETTSNLAVAASNLAAIRDLFAAPSVAQQIKQLNDRLDAVETLYKSLYR
jgi:hypothetical protein